MLRDIYPLYLANEPVFSNADLVVTDKYSAALATRVALADAKTIDAGIAAAEAAEDMTEIRNLVIRRRDG